MERIQKLIAKAGIASRRKAEQLIREKKVEINNHLAKLGDKASLADEIRVEGILLENIEEKVYYLINKPKRVITSLKDPRGRKIITNYIEDSRRIFPVERLDYDTTGTLILTNDGELAFRLTHPSYEVQRVYRARISKALSKKDLLFLNSDKVIINHKKSLQEVKQVDNKSYLITLNVGTYHHVKKLFELVNCKVLSLKRIEFAGLSHKGLAEGQYRRLNIKEIRYLKRLTKMI